MRDSDESPGSWAVVTQSPRERNPPVRQLFLALLGLAATVGTAAAQSPWSPVPLGPPAFPRQTVSTVSMNVPVAEAGGGCSSCAPSAGPLSSLATRVGNSPLTIGRGCANNPGCGSFASERTFLFGGCNQFFNAGNKCGGGGCGTAYGAGGFGDTTPCKYGSYLNR